MSDFEKKIVGAWRNSEIEYNFKADGTIAIYYFIIKTADKGTWCIKENKIDLKYGSILQYEKSLEINYITDKEISITDKSNEVDTVNFMQKVDFDDVDLILGRSYEERPLTDHFPEKDINQKTFKEKAFDFAGSILGIGFFIVLFGFLGYVGFQSFSQESFESKSLILGLPFLLIAIFVIVHLLLEEPYKQNMLKYIFYLFLGIFLGLPLLFLFLKLLFSIFELWWLILCVLMLTSIVMILKKEEIKWTHKVGAIVIIIAALYFLYYARDIFEIRFDIFFDNEKLGF